LHSSLPSLFSSYCFAAPPDLHSFPTRRSSDLYLVGHSSAMAKKDAAVMQLHIGLPTVLAVFLMALPLAVLFAAVLLTIALFAKSYKEAQSYLTPMTFIVIIPAVASLMPGVELTPKLALVPILNTSLVCKDIVAGTYHWNSIALIFLSTCVYAAAALFL